MSKIVEMLRRLTGAKVTPGASELRAAEEEARTALAVAEAAIVRMEQERADALIGGDDKALERIEAQSALTARERDRARLAIATLGTRAQEAEEREETLRIDALIQDADRAAETAAVLLRARYEPAAREVAALLDRAEEADALVREARAASLAAGRPFAVRDVSERLTVEGRVFVPFSESVSLRPVGRFPGWGRAREFFEGTGFSPELANPSR